MCVCTDKKDFRYAEKSFLSFKHPLICSRWSQMKQAYLSEIFKEKKLNKRERFEIRVTLIEKRIIEKSASKAGLNPSEYIRRSALEKVIKT